MMAGPSSSSSLDVKPFTVPCNAPVSTSLVRKLFKIIDLKYKDENSTSKPTPRAFRGRVVGLELELGDDEHAPRRLPWRMPTNMINR